MRMAALNRLHSLNPMNQFRGAAAWLAAVLSLMTPAAHASGVQQAFLVQNSGWMEPFYADPQSQLKPLVAAVAQAASSPDDHIFTLAFNQSNGGNVSPKLLGEGRGAAEVAHYLAVLAVAHKGNGGSGQALADTDFQEAITKTIIGPFQSRPGIVWIFTNNKNSPGNDPATAARNRDFYNLLHVDPSITKTVVFPLKMPVQGKLFAARGLMVYALAYGDPAAQALDHILEAGRLSKVLTNAPARLKPIDQDAVRIIPESVKNDANVHVSLAGDQRTLVLDVDAANLVPTVVLEASLQNMFYPYLISHAEVHAALRSGGQSAALEVSPATVTALTPGSSQAVEVKFSLPMAQIPSPWSAQALAAMGKRVTIPIAATLSLEDQHLAVADSFVSELHALFPADPISEVFTPPENVHVSQARVPMVVRVQYPMLPVLVVMGGLLALVGGLAALAIMSTQSRRFPLVVDGLRRQVLLKPFATAEVKDGDGQTIGAIRRGLGRPQVLNVSEGHTIVLG